MTRCKLQVRRPRRAYRTVQTARAQSELYWAFQQYLTPDGVDSVRIVDARGNVVARATPRGRS